MKWSEAKKQYLNERCAQIMQEHGGKAFVRGQQLRGLIPYRPTDDREQAEELLEIFNDWSVHKVTKQSSVEYVCAVAGKEMRFVQVENSCVTACIAICTSVVEYFDRAKLADNIKKGEEEINGRRND